MKPEDYAAYVDAAAALAGVDLRGPRREAVLVQFSRIAAIAEFVMQHELPADVEPATVMRHD